jgi:hypothetical protein
VEYGPVIEYGTATRAPGNHLAAAIANVTRTLQDELADALEPIQQEWQR